MTSKNNPLNIHHDYIRIRRTLPWPLWSAPNADANDGSAHAHAWRTDVVPPAGHDGTATALRLSAEWLCTATRLRRDIRFPVPDCQHREGNCESDRQHCTGNHWWRCLSTAACPVTANSAAFVPQSCTVHDPARHCTLSVAPAANVLREPSAGLSDLLSARARNTRRARNARHAGNADREWPPTPATTRRQTRRDVWLVTRKLE